MTDEQLDHSLMRKGKYGLKTANEVADLDAKYLIWAYENWQPRPCSLLLYKACLADVQARDQGL